MEVLKNIKKKAILSFELGRFFNTKDKSKTFEDSYSYISSKDIEAIRLSDFVFDLLMPREFIEHILYTRQISDLETMSKLLGVSKKSLVHRLEKLKII